MPSLSFVYPEAFWLLLILLPIWLVALFSPRRLSPVRFWVSLGLRTVLVVLLVFSLAGTQILQDVKEVTTVFLIDGSDSILPSARGEAETFIQEALQNKEENDQAAIVVFGENALVERVPSSDTVLGQLSSRPGGDQTDIEEAIQLGLALLPSDTQKRLVLLSDGGENSGQAEEAAGLAVTRNVPLDTVDLSLPESSGEALIAGLQAPDRVRDGQDLELVATVESSVDQAASLRILANQEVIADQDVQLAEGSNEFRFVVNASGQGFVRYRAQIEPLQDSRLQNNEAAAMVHIQGPPRVLLVEGEAGEADALAAALQAANINTETVLPPAMPNDLAGLGAYEGVVLVNVAAGELPVKAVAALPTYVRDLGRGLVMIGGNESYGVGGYGDTAIEEALPVHMDVRNRQERPDLALIFVIDKSGSMDACHCNGPDRRAAPLDQSGDIKLDIAKEAVTQASALLGAQDTLGIVGFDTSAHWLLPTTRNTSPDEVAAAVADVSPIGDTNVRAGLQAASDALNNTNARIKHVVLLTDGWGEGIDNQGIGGSIVNLAEDMNSNGITMSVVAAGNGSAPMLEQLAVAGGGRYYPAEDMAEVPEIFLQETIVAAGNYIVEHPFFPVLAGDSPVLDALDDTMPALYGYNGSTLKETARSILVTDDGSPLLAQWQYGLGRSIAWTSDTKARWARDWVAWEQFPRFTAQMVGWVLPAQPDQGIITDVQVQGDQTTLGVTLENVDGSPRDDAQLSARLLPADERDPDDQTDQAEPSSDIRLVQVSPGEYQAIVPTPDPGTYFIQIQGQEGGQYALQHLAGLVVPYSSEYRQHQSNPALLRDLSERTGGRDMNEPTRVFEPGLEPVARAQEIALPLLLLALLLLPVDIAARRMLLRRADLQALRRQTQRQAQPATPAPAADSTLERLARARNRANASRAERTAAAPPSAQRQEAARPEQPPRTPPHQSPRSPVPGVPELSNPTAQRRSEQAATEGDPLERLRAAKERARRRARGEE